jgi:hypothetical protein
MVLSVCVLVVIVGHPGDIGLASELGARMTETAAARTHLSWDVAIDCRTWRFNLGISDAEFGRGDGFIANGKIFPVRTIPSGDQSNDPNDPGSIGNWVERGTMAATAAEIDAGSRPAFFATWYHFLNDGLGLVADGPHPDAGPMAVIGGMGALNGASGELDVKIIGTNITGCPNLRLRATLGTRTSK